jgi:hypothetical protein
MRGTTLGFTIGMVLFAAGGAGCGPAPAARTGGSTAAVDAAVSIGSPCRKGVPAALAVPAGNELELALDAAGVQIYTCTANATGAAWVFTAPEATLYSQNGRVAGRHYAGPTWEANDGSTVKGARLAGVTVDPTAIPWLLLGAVSHTGDGRMSEVTFVQRVATVGGLAPAAADCTVSTVGTVARVPYTATYCFSEGED